MQKKKNHTKYATPVVACVKKRQTGDKQETDRMLAPTNYCFAATTVS